jgi:hypothetical protein
MTNPSHIVSLTFDDALEVHLDRVVPLLDQHGFKGTFFVTVGADSFCRRLDAWRSAAATGHELGNHTLLHPAVRGKDYVTEGNAIERYTLDRMRTELEMANRILTGVDGCHERTFAYPCCNPVLGTPGWAKRVVRWLGLDRTRLMGFVARHPGLDLGTTERSYEPVVKDLFLAARIGGERFSAGPDYPPRQSAVPCVALDGKNLDELKDLVEDFCRQEWGWLVLMAHGVGGGHRLSCDADVFEGFLRLLKTRTLTVLPFGGAARQVYGVGNA